MQTKGPRCFKCNKPIMFTDSCGNEIMFEAAFLRVGFGDQNDARYNKFLRQQLGKYYQVALDVGFELMFCYECFLDSVLHGTPKCIPEEVKAPKPQRKRNPIHTWIIN